MRCYFCALFVYSATFTALLHLRKSVGGWHNMGDRFRRIFCILRCKMRYIILLLVWCTGLIAGTIFALKTGDDYIQLFQSAAAKSVSIVPLLITELTPFALCAYFCKHGKHRLIYILCLIKALAFSHSALTAFLAFNNAGWLIQPLLQFTTLLTTPLFCWFAIRCIQQNRSLTRDFCISICAGIAVVCFDFGIISPFLAMIIEH